MACELVKALTEKFPEQTTALFTEYVAAMLASYASNPTTNWKAKDCAMYLVTALTVKGSTQAAGVTATNQLVNIGDFFTQQVLVDHDKHTCAVDDSRRPSLCSPSWC